MRPEYFRRKFFAEPRRTSPFPYATPTPPSRASGAAAEFTDADGDDVPIPCGFLEVSPPILVTGCSRKLKYANALDTFEQQRIRRAIGGRLFRHVERQRLRALLCLARGFH